MNVIGIWNITFDKKTNFIYKVNNRLQAFTIRKIPWRHHIENPDFSSISKTIRSNVQNNYLTCIKTRITLAQKRYLS